MPKSKPVRKPKGPARAPRGTGSVFLSAARGVWIARKPVGKKGRHTLYLTRTGKTQTEAIRRRDEALPPGPKTTVAEWAERWLEAADVREQTRDLYRQSVELRINPQLGGRPAAEVTPFDVERAAAAWGKEVAANTVRKHLSHLRSLFSAAARAGLVARNPVALAKKPKSTKVEIDPLDGPELAAVVRAAAADPKTRRLAVMAALGLRIGEAIAFRPADYSPAAGTLAVCRNRTVRHGVGPPKSANSLRTVRVPTAARAAAAAPGPELNHKTAARRWAKLLKGLGLRARGPHQARHSVATLAIARRVPIANVARDLGDTVETVVRTYLHPAPGADLCAAMEGLFRESLGGGRVPAEAPKPLRALRKPGRRRKSG